MSRCHVAEKRPNYVFQRAHVRKKGGRGAERGEDDLSRARLSGCRGGCSAGIYGIGEEWSSTARTLGDAPAQKRQSDLGRAGSRCYLRDAARLCTQPGHGATQRTHGTRMCVHTRCTYIPLTNYSTSQARNRKNASNCVRLSTACESSKPGEPDRSSAPVTTMKVNLAG